VVTQLKAVNSGVPQDSVLQPVHYLLYTADFALALSITTAIYADNIVILAAHKNYIKTSQCLEEGFFYIQKWLKKWRIRINEAKSVQMISITCRKTCPPIILNSLKIPQAEDAKYLGLHLDCRLNWKKHINTKRKQLGIQLSKMYWLLGSKSQLSIENKLLLYKAILKSIWIYDVQLWGTASNSNIEIIQRFQNKYLNALWYVTNDTLHHDIIR